MHPYFPIPQYLILPAINAKPQNIPGDGDVRLTQLWWVK